MWLRQSFSMSLLGAVALAGLSAAHAAASAETDSFLLMRRVSIIDPTGFGRPMEAASILLPKDWKVESSVVWDALTGCVRSGVKLSLKAQSPDGKMGFEIFPNYFWNWMNDPQARYLAQQEMGSYGIKGCDNQPPYDAAGYVQNLFLPRWRTGSTLVGVGRVPELIEALQVEFKAMTGGNTGPVQTDFDVVLAAIETPRAGSTDEEWVLASVMRNVAYLPTVSSMMGGTQQMSGNYNMAAVNQFAARAPKGQLEKHEKLFEVIYRSFRLNSAWDTAINQHFLNLDRINLKGIQDRHRIFRQSQQEISAMMEQGYQGRQAIMDRTAEKQIQALRGVETYIDPATQSRVDLSAGYQGAWTNGLGDYVLSDMPGFNPAREMEGNWTALKPEAR